MAARVIDHPAYTGVLPTPYNPDPVLLAIVQTIREGLLRDQHVRLHNFGTFRLRWSKERRIKHPKTGEYVLAAPTPRITFTPAKHLREQINPNPKPVIPLDEPINLQANTQQENNATGSVPSEANLQESIQDIIDTEYSPSHSPANVITKEHAGDSNDKASSSNKKLALGILASVPLIIALLQADFSQQADISPVNDSIAISEIQDKEIIANPTPKNIIVRTETTLPTSIPTSVATARPEPTTQPFYMTPQLHTIQEGDNLWNLAKEFYGDALLWPHIYRANARTLKNPDVISSGKQLVIPGLQQSPDTLSVTDRNLITEGYFQVYQFNKSNNSPEAIYFLIGAKQYSFDWLKEHKEEIPHDDWKIIESGRD